MAARILVADDSVTIQKVVELTFSKEDFVLIQARSGEEAIRRAKAERPDLVLLDLVMPDKNGYEVCAALRAEPGLRGVPVILLTGTFEAYDKDKGIQAGANDFITKPFESQMLVSKVKQLLFAKTMDMAATAPPAGAGRPVPPRVAPAGDASRPAVAATAPPPPRVGPAVPPRTTPQPAPVPGVQPAAMPGPGPARPTAPGAGPPLPGPAARPPLRPAGPPARPTAPAPRPPIPPSAAVAAPPGKPPLERLAPERPASQQPVPARPAPPPPAAATRAGRTLDLSPPTEEIAQDRVWEVVESTPPPTPPPVPGGFGELTLEDLSTLPLPEVPGRPEDLHLELEAVGTAPTPLPGELPSLEVPSLEPEPVERKGGAAAPQVEMGALPESLSLEDLLSAPPPAMPPPMAEAAPVPLEEPSGGPVFDLTSEMEGPSLPLIEVGAGEPPALSIEDLLTSGAAAPPPAGLPELELDLLPGAAAEGAEAGREIPAAPTPLDLGPLVEAPLTESQGITLEPLLEEREAPAVPSEAPSLVSAMEVEAVIADVSAPAAPPVAGEIPAPALDMAEMPAAPPLLPPLEAAMPAPAGLEPVEADMAAMRRAVTERVAHDLTRDLSDKLLERIEQIVWEVVPDLAEILITREIERIKALAEGKQPS